MSNAPYVKQGLTAITPFLAVPDIPAAIDFYVRVFAAREVRRDPGPSGVTQHAVLTIDAAPFELGRHAVAQRGDLPPVGMHLYVPDVDAVRQRAVAAGATATPATDMPYNDRETTIVDPFGITWYVATNRGDAARK